MKYKIIFLLGLSVLMLSCEKITNVKVVDGVSTGKLSYQLLDDSGKGLTGVKVTIYDIGANFNMNSPNPDNLVGTIRTDQEGIARFSDLAPKNYMVITDSATVNTVNYHTNEFVQVVADTEKKKSLKVSDFSGEFNIRLVSEYDYRTPLKNLGVVAFPAKNYPSSDNVTAVIKAAVLKGVSDENGMVSIKVPANTQYDFIVHSLKNGNLGYGHGIYSVGKGLKNSFTLYTHPF